MLNKKSTGKSSFWKTGFVIPFLIIFIIGFQVKTEARVVSATQNVQDSIPKAVITDLAVTIDSESSEKSIEEMSQFLKDEGISLILKDIKRNDAGLITSISASFKTEKGKSGNYSQSNTNGINTFEFFSSRNGTVGFREPREIGNKSAATTNADPFSKIGKQPLIIFEGKEYETTDLYEKAILLRNGYEALSAEETMSKYGKKSKDGAIVISEGEIINTIQEAYKKLNDKTTRHYIHFTKNAKPSFVTIQKSITDIQKPKNQSSTSVHISGSGTFSTDSSSFVQKWNKSKLYTQDINASQFQNSDFFSRYNFPVKPLIIINGEIQKKDFKMNSIDPENIEKINVLKEESAMNKYGEKAKDGAIEITLKEGTTNTEHDENTHTGAGVTGAVAISSSTINNESSQSITIRGTGKSKFSRDAALYVIDGEEMEKDFDLSTIDANDIKSIHVHSGENAVKKYGEKASEGVIEITLKEE